MFGNNDNWSWMDKDWEIPSTVWLWVDKNWKIPSSVGQNGYLSLLAVSLLLYQIGPIIFSVQKCSFSSFIFLLHLGILQKNPTQPENKKLI